MAILIPRDLSNAPDARPNDVRVGEALRRALPEDVWVWYNSPRHSSRPRYVLISPSHGIAGIQVYDWSPLDVEAVTPTGIRIAGGTLLDPIGELGRSLEALRQQVRGLHPEPPIAGLIVLPNFREDELEPSPLWEYFSPGVAIAGDCLSNGQLAGTLRSLPRPLEATIIEEIRGRLYPETQFQRVRIVQDGERRKRVTLRLQLDAEQENLARSLGTGVTLLSGVSGSGKSLVLCARARFLAAEHPKWTIQMLCFNRSLVGYLRELVGGVDDRVHIDTFYGWAHRLGVRLPWLGNEESQRRSQDALKRVIARDVRVGTCDAMLVDEGQDFAGPWLLLAHRVLTPGRGGMVIATDMAQCIYREEALGAVLPPGEVTHVELKQNYRNTEQIGRFALGAVFNAADTNPSEAANPGGARSPTTPEFALSGQPVQMVWAERWDDQASFTARQIRQLVDERRATYRDVAVLYTQRSGMVRRILSALDAQEIPHFWVNRNQETKASLDLADNSVKVMTVHSSKGLEFSVVFLFGVEALRVPPALRAASEEDANRTRVAYVGMTRAQDLLYLTYTRRSPILDRALRLGDWCQFWTYPEDFDFD